MIEQCKTSKLGFQKPAVWNIEIPFATEPAQHATLTQNFVNAILDGEPLIAPGEEGIHSIELANAMLYSGLIGPDGGIAAGRRGLREEIERVDRRLEIREEGGARLQRGFHANRFSDSHMILTGIGDEAGVALDAQIKATHELGWKYIEMRAVEVPGFAKGNFHDIPDKAFDIAAGQLEEAGLGVYCFGSAIANWSKKFTDPFEITLDEVKRCIPRMQRLGAKLVRIMSFKPGDQEHQIPPEVIPPQSAK